MTDLESLLTAAAERLTLPDMLRLQDAAEALARDPQFHPAPAPLTPARGWFQAALLEKRGRHAEAAALLESLPEPDWGDSRALWLLTRARLALETAGNPRYLLRLATRAAQSYRLLRQLDSAWRSYVKRAGAESLKPLRIAFAGTVTADLLFPALRAELFADGIHPEIWAAPFGQYQQVILADDPALRAFRPDIVVFAADWRSAAQASSAAAHAEELAALWPLYRSRYGAAAIQWNFEVPSIDPMGR